MSKRETKTHTHRAKDGLYYSDYQSMVNANVKVNNARLEKLGLGESFNKKDKAPKKNNNKQKRKAPPTPSNGELRRSNRVRMVTPEFSLLPETFLEPRNRKKTAGSRSNAQRKLEVHELEALKNLPDWLDGMEEFLLTVPHGGNNKVVSRDNARCVMRQTRLMVAGMGIEYHNWEEGVIWKKGVKIDLSMDFEALHEEATAFEAEHGRDRGNGWLMRHALRKLQCYQQYLANKGTGTEDTNGEEDAEETADTKGSEEQD